ncbi:MAG: zinc-binding alcohol dehydrogenase family protein [Pseudomonadota bacterium]
MKAVGYQKSLAISEPNALLDIELPAPVPGDNDLLVKVTAVAVNPVDTKIRQRVTPDQGYKVLGWDAVGEVLEVGRSVSGFKPGDRVWYAGDITRPGCNAQQQLVDYRIAAKAPATLDDIQAAAMPLTSITAWELLFDRLKLNSNSPHNKRCLLVIGAAGGVGSVMVQLAKQLTDATVVATASRPESKQWVKALGADHVIDHSQPLAAQLDDVTSVTDVALLTHSDQYFDAVADLIAAQGQIGIIDDPTASLDITKLKQKSVSLHWEFMYTRSMFQTEDMAAQGQLLSKVAELVDNNQVRSTLGQNFGPLNAVNLIKAHSAVESGKTIGKIALTVQE